jgi:hypothetical protein
VRILVEYTFFKKDFLPAKIQERKMAPEQARKRALGTHPHRESCSFFTVTKKSMPRKGPFKLQFSPILILTPLAKRKS